MIRFSMKDAIAGIAILAVGLMAIFVSPSWFAALIFPMAIWTDVWARKKNNNG